MPSASANISAKFIAQIEIGETSVPRKSRPAEAISPTMVSISGRPAATSEPKASTRIAMVTGQEMNSDLSIASRFAWLKSDHIPEAPVRLTATPGPAASASLVLRRSAASTIAFGSAAAPARITAVWPSGEIETPGCGGETRPTAGSRRRTRCERATACRNSGAVATRSREWTATCSA